MTLGTKPGRMGSYMHSFVRLWLRCLLGVAAVIFVAVCARTASAYPGPLNLNGSAGAGYITSGVVVPNGGCIGCHGDFGSAPFPHNDWGIGTVAPALTISGAGTGTTHVTNADGNGGIFTVQPGKTATFNLTFHTLLAAASGGFLAYHNDGTNESSGALVALGAEHTCPDGVSGTLCGATQSGTGNHEIMHSFPQATSNGSLSFNFEWTAPAATCAGSFSFTVWVNAENADSNCGPPDSSYSFTFTINLATCNDGNACNGVETCSTTGLNAGKCMAGTPVTCTASDQCHGVGTCNAGTGVCTNPALTGTSCNDSDLCTTGDVCTAGTCAGTPVTCSALDQCHSAGTCNAGTGLCSNPTLTGNSCNDGNLCTTGDVCNAGTCAGTPVTCSALDQCHSAGTCNAGTGVCSNPTLTGNSCNDGNSCTTGDTCQAGACVGVGMTCTALDQCHGVGTCSGGVCTNPVLSGAACNDNNACTAGETCSAGGVCQGGTAVPTDDGNPCTADACTPAGGVTHTPILPVPVCHDGSRGPCDAVVMCTTGGICPPLAVAPATTQCSGPSCSNGPPSVETFASLCDGTHTTCPAATTQDCSGAACVGNVCGGGCAGNDANCVTGDFCNVNVCTPKLGTGKTCSGNNNCALGFCVDGVCCNTACGGGDPTDCQACNLTAAQGGTPGTCSVPVGQVCRAAVAAAPGTTASCDAAEVCAAGNTACPPDLPAAAGTVCRTSADGNLCDPAETCNGFNCPANTSTRDGQACTDDGNPCSLDLCESNACTHNQAAAATVLCRASKGVCDPLEDCDGTTTTCPADVIFNAAHVCRPVAAGETCDVAESCTTGGPNCPPDGFDANTVSCGAASCAFGTETLAVNCPGSNGTCPTATTKACSPYLCAGTACGTTCAVKTDCAANFYCNPSHQCVPELTAGAPCTTAESCGTGICVDGVCCNSQCTGQCQACNVATSPGVCSPITDKVPHGSRPACTGDGSACQGVCDGVNTGSCALPGSSTQCRAPTCTGGTATLVAACQGNGTCPAVQTQACAPGICQAASGPKAICVGSNGTPCTADVECQTGNYCSAGVCIPKITDGTACAADSQCANGHCVDNLCCNSACDGQCEACDVAGSPGKCTAVTDKKPHGGRPACVSDPQYPACAGQCDGKNLLACVFPGAGTSCRDASCTNDVATLPASCTGTGTCSPAQQQACQAPNGCDATATICENGCASDRDCAVNKYCSGGVCVPTLPLGASCSTSGQCTAFCVDGVCCNTSCDHQCEACNKEGICSPVTGAPVLPRQACNTDGNAACVGTCNGTNPDACTYPGDTKQCSAGSCASGVATLTTFCDGEGSCPLPQNQICAPADCVGTLCGGGCPTIACAAGSYCSAGVCEPKLGQGKTCNDNSQCANGLCTDGFCCDQACNGQCQACDVAGSEGTCTTLTGDLPHGGRAACPGFGACAATCDGTSATACSYASATITCGKASCSQNGQQLAAPLCNGAGSCQPAVESNCGSYACDPPSGTCLTSCVLDTDCAAGFQCVNAKCQPQQDAGIADSGADSSVPPDGSVTTDASIDGTAPDATADATVSDSGSAGAADDAGTPLVPPNRSTDKGSCGCSVPGTDTGNSSLLLLASLGLLGMAARRRKRRAA